MDFPFLASLAKSDRRGDRDIWLRVASDHFVAARPRDAEKLAAFANVMIPALEAADASTQFEVARRLAPCPETPRALIAWLEAASPELSDYILEHAVGIADADLLRAARRSGRAASAAAKRKALSPTLVDSMSRLEHLGALIVLASAASAPLGGSSLVRLLLKARSLAEAGDRRLADALLERRPVEPECAILFLEANPAQRVEILLAAQRVQLGRPPGGLAAPIDQPALERLELAAIARHPDRFVVALAEALGCKQDLALRIVADASGEPLAVALAALGAPNDTLVRVLISNDLDAGGYRRIQALARLNAALNRHAAAAVISALRDGTIGPERPAPRSATGIARLHDRARSETPRSETAAPVGAKPAASLS